MNIIIKQAENSDITEIARLFDAYRVFYKQKSDLKLAVDFLSERIKNAESIIYYATNSKGEYLGFTQLYPSFSSASAKRVWVLNDLYVKENARGKDVAKELMNQAKEYAVKTKAKGLSLCTAKTNTTAQHLYESLNYIKNRDFDYYFLTTE